MFALIRTKSCLSYKNRLPIVKKMLKAVTMGKRGPAPCCARVAASAAQQQHARCPIKLIVIVTHPRAAACRTLRGSTHSRAHQNRGPLLRRPPAAALECSAAPRGAAAGGLSTPAPSCCIGQRAAPLRGASAACARIRVPGLACPAAAEPVCVRSAAGPSVCWSLRSAAPPPLRARVARCAAPLRAPSLVGGGGCAQSLKSRLRLLLGPVPVPSALAPSPQPPGLRPGALARLPGFFPPQP